METVKEKINKDLVKLVQMRELESRLQAILNKLRKESLEKLKWYENHRHKLMAIICHHQSRSELPDVVMPELCHELIMALAETPNDDTGHAVSGGDVDDTERRTDDAADSSSPGEPNRT